MASLYGKFADAARLHASRTAIEVQRRDAVETWTYAELERRVGRLATFLTSHGVGAGDRCVLLAGNDAQWSAAFLAMLRLGAVPVPLDTTYTADQVARLIADSEARVALVSTALHDRLDRASGCRALILDRETGDGLETPTDPEPARVKPDDPAVILYTSGTTSDPKGVVLTHHNLRSEIESAFQVVVIESEDAVLGVLPLFHALALLANLLLPFSAGARVVYLESVTPEALLRALREREITAFCCVPQFFYLIHKRILDHLSRASRPRRSLFRLMLGLSGLLRERLGINVGPRLFARVHRALGPKMRLLVTGGSSFDPRVGRDLYRLGFNILQAYGLTETSGAATVLHTNDRHVGSVGPPLPGVEIEIRASEIAEQAAAERDGASVKIGEIAVRGPVVSPGYFRRPDVNAVTFRDGWLHTGDLGYLDRSGRLYVTGRAKDVIVLGSGKNIHPEEIEAHYAQSPFIKEICVMGRSLPGAPESERLHAVVVPDFDLLREKKIFNSRDYVRFEIENLSAELPGHKRILSYDVVTDDLPRTTTRKLKRFVIEQRLVESGEEVRGAGPGAADASPVAWDDAPHVAPTLELIRNIARPSREIEPSAHLELDIGLDSMGRVELFSAIEARLGAKLSDEVVHEIHTVGELVDAVGRAGDDPTREAAPTVDPWHALLDDASDDDPALESILAPRPLLNLLLFGVAKVIYAVSWLLVGLRVSGREHLPERGPYLISPNHQSFLDAFLLAGSFPFRVCRDSFYVGASEYFSTPLSAWFARMIQVVPLDADSNLVRAMRAGAQGLRRDKILVLFPEGERSIDGTIRTFKKGAAILSTKLGAPIVPVAIDGFHELWPRGGKLRLRKLLPFSGTRTLIRFGPPLPPVEAERATEAVYASVTSRLRETVSAMLDRLRDRDDGATT